MGLRLQLMMLMFDGRTLLSRILLESEKDLGDETVLY